MRSLYAGQGRAAAAERVLTEGRRIDPRDMCEPPPIFVAPSVARISPVDFRHRGLRRLKAGAGWWASWIAIPGRLLSGNIGMNRRA